MFGTVNQHFRVYIKLIIYYNINFLVCQNEIQIDIKH